MAKAKSVFFCKSCGAQASKWLGKCPSCGEWNTYTEEIIHKSTSSKGKLPFEKSPSKAKPIREIEQGNEIRNEVNDKELDRVLGGGLVSGSLVLVGGEPGIGKSTLMLQVALKLNKSVMYISGEESESQIKMRAERIGIENEKCFVLAETSTSSIFQQLVEKQPEVVVVDSIQTMHTEMLESSPGSISQIRECAGEFLKYAKESNTPVILIGHITKDGQLAGPKLLEHMVDVVLQFEGDQNHAYRLLRTTKNRFGSTNELGIYEMTGDGLRQVENPSEVLISDFEEPLSGVAIASTIEGVRPLLIEVQALVSTAAYGTPQRSSTGFDLRRLNMLLAVLEKRCGFRLASKDVFLNITGGLRVDDPAIDMAVIAAILSSSEDRPIDQKMCFAAEIGLSGEVRPVSRLEQRVSEAQKLGYEQILLSSYNNKHLQKQFPELRWEFVSSVEEMYFRMFRPKE